MASGIFVGLSTIDLIYTVDECPGCKLKSGCAQSGGSRRRTRDQCGHRVQPSWRRCNAGFSADRHPLAALLKSELQRYQVEHIDLAPESDEPPAVSSVWVNLGEYDSDRNPDPAGRSVETGTARILMVDGHSMSACLAWASAARCRDTPVVFDGGSWKPGTEDLLRSVNTTICSADFRPPGCSDEASTIAYLRSAGVQQIAITHGANPIRVVAGSFTATVEVPHIEAVDTTGAGDIFHGAFCYFVCGGCEFVDVLRQASRVAAESCRFHGTREWMQAESGSQT